MHKGIIAIVLLSVVILTVGGLTSSVLAFHVDGHLPEQAPEKIPDGPQKGDDLKNTIVGLIDWLFVALLLAATIFIVLAAFQFATGGGDATKVSEARQKLLYAIIAVVVAAFAKGIPVVIKAIVGV